MQSRGFGRWLTRRLAVVGGNALKQQVRLIAPIARRRPSIAGHARGGDGDRVTLTLGTEDWRRFQAGSCHRYLRRLPRCRPSQPPPVRRTPDLEECAFGVVVETPDQALDLGRRDLHQHLVASVPRNGLTCRGEFGLARPPPSGRAVTVPPQHPRSGAQR